MQNFSTQAWRQWRLLMLCAALCQAFLPLSAQAAMGSADASSPYYCGQMSSQFAQQLRAMDLPPELVQQLLPDASTTDCEFCASGVFDLAQLSGPAAVAVTPVSALAPSAGVAGFGHTQNSYSARAPPQ